MTGGSPLHGTNVRVSVCANQGGRKYMEDRVHIHCERTPNGQIDYIFVAVYDGHGGSSASDYAREHLLRTITEHRGFNSDNDDDVLQAIKDGFIQTHHAMWKVVGDWPRTASGYSSTAGTTASCAFIRKGKLYTGHVGDSAIVLGRRTANGSVVGERITIDHKPDTPAEKNRIEQTGGEVLSKAGVMRVVWTRTIRGHEGPVRRSTRQEKIPFLAVARALGDLWSYNQDMDDFIVSPDPDVEVRELTADDLCLVLGSDGLWNVIRAQYAADIVNTHEWRELEEKPANNNHLLDRSTHSNHSRWLVRHALRGWGCLRADNVTVITVIFDPPNAKLPTTSPCIERSDKHLAIEDTLVEQPQAMVRICPQTVQVLRTAPVELIYTGAKDPPPPPGVAAYRVTLNFKGPGFSPAATETGIRKRNSTGALVRPPIVASATGDSDDESCPTPTNTWTSNNSSRSNASDDDDVDAEDENEAGPSAPKRSKPSYYCTKHGLSCEKVKRMNAAKQEKPANPAPPTPGSNGTTPKPKYFCRRHGLTCEKVKKMNDDWAKSRAEKSVAEPDATVNGTAAVNTPAVPKRTVTKTGLTDSTARITLREKSQSAGKEVSKKSHAARLRSSAASSSAVDGTPPTFHNTRQWSRVTRSGRHFSPVKSAPTLRPRRVVKVKRPNPRPSSATPRRANHKHGSLPQSSTRPKSAVSVSAKKVTPEQKLDVVRLSSSVNTRSTTLLSSLNLETQTTSGGYMTRRYSSQLLACNISPRLLARASVNGHDLVPEHERAAMKRKLFEENGQEPEPKRSRIWELLTLKGFFGGPGKTA